VQRLLRIFLATLLIGLVFPAGALAQDAPTMLDVRAFDDRGPAPVPSAGQPTPLVAPRQFQTRFDVVGVPEQFDQVLLIVDFPAGTWTPLHTPGGRVYHTVIEGSISTRLPWTEGVYETTYEAGETFVSRPNESMQVGNATSAKTRVMATALLPPNAPLTSYQDGFSSSRYPTLTDWNAAHDLVIPEPGPGPTTAYRSVTRVSLQEGAIELVQLVLEFGASPLLTVISDNDVRESCLTAWSRVSTNILDILPAHFERVASNLCVSSAYVPFAVAPSRG
jgi:quercetin dioxygenase-like cupin family protein